MDEATVQKLINAFSYSFNDDEACIYAWISKNTLYSYIEKNPEFWTQKELLKKTPNIKAKLNWLDKISAGDYNASKDWLERKSRDEFWTKTTIEWKITNLNPVLTEEEHNKIMQALWENIT